MNLSNDDIDSFFNHFRSKFSNQDRQESRKKLLNILQRLSFPLSSESRTMRMALSSLDPEALDNAVLYQDRRAAIGYLLEAIFYRYPKVKQIPHYNDSFIRAYLPNIDNNLIANLLSTPTTQFRPVQDDDDMREMLVASLALNRLTKCPNFQYLYSQLRAKPPLTIDKNPYCWFPDSDSGWIGCWEVLNGPTLAAIIPGLDSQRFLNYYSQVVLALTEAKRLCQFTHYNLTADNVVIVKVPTMTINYFNVLGNKYLTTDHLVKIVNYRSARIVTALGGQLISMGSDDISVYSDRAWILQDCYTLLMTCLKIAYNSNNDQVLSAGKEILQFFTKEDLATTLERQQKNLFHLPYAKSWSIDYFLRYLNNSDLLTVRASPQEIKPYQMRSDYLNCLSLSIKVPNDILNFYDLLYILSQQERLKEVKNLKDNFNYPTNLDSFLVTVNALRDKQQMLISDLDYIPNQYDQFKQSIIKLFTLVDSMITFLYYLRLCLEVCKLYDDEINRNRILERYNPHIKAIEPVIVKWNPIILNNISNPLILDYWQSFLNWNGSN